MNRFVGLIINPKNEFNLIKNENKQYLQIIKSFLSIVVLIRILFSSIHLVISGPYESFGYLWSVLLIIVVSSLIIPYSYIVAKIINKIAQLFGFHNNFEAAIKVSSYSTISIIVSGLLGFIPIKYFGFLPIVYSIYLRYIGLRIVMNCTKRTLLIAVLPEIIIIAFFALLTGILDIISINIISLIFN